MMGITSSIEDVQRKRDLLDFHCLKIDKFSIDGLLSTEPEESMTDFIISMAHRFGNCTIAEGVETVGQLNSLLQIDCDMAQGYLFSKPLDADRAIDYVRTFSF